MRNYFYFRDHLCITFELLGLNLYEVIKENGFKGFDLNCIRTIARQILKSLVLLQERKIIHCDLKPENVLVRDWTTYAVKVIDFGSSCYSHEKGKDRVY